MIYTEGQEDAKTSTKTDEFEEETSQLWILRHSKDLLKSAAIEEEAISDFILHQDITEFRNFMMNDPRLRKALFLTIERRVVPIESAIDTAAIFASHLASLAANESQPKIHKMQKSNTKVDSKSDKVMPEKGKKDGEPKAAKPIKKETENKKTKDEAVSPKKTKKNKKGKNSRPDLETDGNTTNQESDAEKQNKRKSKKKKKKKKLEKTDEPATEAILTKSREQSNKEILQELVQQEFTALESVEMTETHITLKWNDLQKIPDENEFIYILTKSDSLEQNKSEKSEFDQTHYVDYCPDKTEFVRALETANTIVGIKLKFEQQINMLVSFQTAIGTPPPIKWEDQNYRFENFICNCVIHGEKSRKHAYNPSASEDFIENLLRPRIYEYVKDPNKVVLNQLLLELSLYELKLINKDPFSANVTDCLQRALTIFSVIHIFYLQNSRELVHKALFHCIELTSRMLASNLQQRIWNLLGEDCLDICNRKFSKLSDSEHHSICRNVRPLLLEFIRLGNLSMAMHTDEYNCLIKIQQCLKIMDFIEEDFDKLVKLVDDLRNPRRDMTFDRTKLDDAKEIIRQIWETFEEGFFESSLESGNFEAMKNIYLQLSQFLVQLSDTIPSISEYCL